MVPKRCQVLHHNKTERISLSHISCEGVTPKSCPSWTALQSFGLHWCSRAGCHTGVEALRVEL